jgi:ferredoxin
MMPTTTGVKIKLTINGRELVCSPNQTVLDVALENGISIPTLCYNPLFDKERPGSCRLCLVEVIAGGRPGLQPSCTLPVSSGLNVSTQSEAVYQARRTAVELLLSEHIQRCRDCAMSGDCLFAKLCKEYDINGVSVCSECPNQGESCFLSRGVLCLGSITYAGCGAYCTRDGYPCEGCHSIMVNEDLLRFGLTTMKEKGFTAEEIIEGAKVFSFDQVKILKKVLVELDMMEEQGGD